MECVLKAEYLAKEIQKQFPVLDDVHDPRRYRQSCYNQHGYPNVVKILGTVRSAVSHLVVKPVDIDQYPKNRSHLGGGFPLGQNMGNDWLANLECKNSVCGNKRIPDDNHPNHPGENVAEYCKSNQGRTYQDFVSQRIHKLAEAGNNAEFSGIPAVIPVC